MKSNQSRRSVGKRRSRSQMMLGRIQRANDQEIILLKIVIYKISRSHSERLLSVPTSKRERIKRKKRFRNILNAMLFHAYVKEASPTKNKQQTKNSLAARPIFFAAVFLIALAVPHDLHTISLRSPLLQ